MPSSSLSLIVSVAVLLYVVWSQLQVRPARTRQGLPIALIVLGAASLYAYNLAHPLSHGADALIGASLLFVAIGLGAVRAYTVKVWLEGGQLMRQGTWLTAALWVGGMALHLALDHAAGDAGASGLLYLGLTLLAQRMALQSRAARVPA